MLRLENIVKKYTTGELTQHALKDVSITFRENEFVSILGPSGSGKTTMLNIIGGLDRYDSGDLNINGVSTKEYKDGDWDVYRNDSIGFVFQSYNLIPHQTVLSNVELALTLAGISKKERRKRAKEVLEKVGLKDHMHKKPNQMSGGQMQRVAIARALINNPDILLADEPTGALDSETSVQIMELLKEIAKDKLVIMVTHNPELAQEYSTRIVNLLDGQIISDTDPYEVKNTEKKEKSKKKVSMSFFTALALSFNNLKTKKGRTALTSFAGSIGIIGIALILALSSGMHAYIAKVEEDTLSSYPITIQSQGIDLLETREENMATIFGEEDKHDNDKIYQRGYVSDLLEMQTMQLQNNDLKTFKEFIESEEGKNITQYTNDVQYGYDIDLQIFKADTSDGILQINPSELLVDENQAAMQQMTEMSESLGMSNDIWVEMLDNDELLDSQYDVIAGHWPKEYDEVVLIVSDENEISDMLLYTLGLKDEEEFRKIKKKVNKNKEIDNSKYEKKSYTYDEILDTKYKLIKNTDYYERIDGVWVDKSGDEDYMKEKIEDGIDLKIVGIIKPNEEAAATSLTGTIAYTAELTEYMVKQVNDSKIVKEQKKDKKVNVFTGTEFIDIEGMSQEEIISTLPQEQQMQLMMLSEQDRITYMSAYAESLSATYKGNLETLGVVNLNRPSSVSLYLKDFESRDYVVEAIDNYNQKQKDEGHDEYSITYTDLVGVMTSSMTDVIDMITYLLIGFVSISLVVSSIMIGIITYISVLERTKEIGILRSIGASKKDISRVFNAETTIVGLASGLMGIGISLLLIIPANAIIGSLTSVRELAVLPTNGAIALVVISVTLTLIAGLVPSRMAAKKDPVIALRTE